MAPELPLTRHRTLTLKVYQVTLRGVFRGFTTARVYDPCLAALARLDGYSVSVSSRAAVVTKEMAVAAAVDLSDEDFKALLAARKAAGKATR
jgi:hypothetical protein